MECGGAEARAKEGPAVRGGCGQWTGDELGSMEPCRGGQTQLGYHAEAELNWASNAEAEPNWVTNAEAESATWERKGPTQLGC